MLVVRLYILTIVKFFNESLAIKAQEQISWSRWGRWQGSSLPPLLEIILGNYPH